MALTHITCLRCGLTSYNPHDVAHGYCGHCHRFAVDFEDAGSIPGYGPTSMEYPIDHARRFELHRDTDETGISGTGLVAEGVVCRDGVAMMRWLTEWPSSVCYYERGLEAVEALHGHGGKTRVVMLDD